MVGQNAAAVTSVGKKPRLMVVHPAADIGGAEICTRDLLRNMQRFDCALLTQRTILDCFIGSVDRTYLFEEYDCHAPYLLAPQNIWKYAQAIKSVIQLEKPDAVIGMTHNGMVYATLASDLDWARRPAFSVIAGHFSAYFNIMINRSPNFHEKMLMRYCFSRTAGIIVPSFGVRDDLIGNFGAHPGKVKAVHNGMDLEAIRKQAGEPVEVTKSCPWIVTSCRLSPPKDVETLLHAFKILRSGRQAKLIIIGEGEFRGQLEALINKLGLQEDVLMLGFCINPFPYVAMADVFVLSSLTEGFGNVIVEAMALGVPVVATDCPTGPAEIIEEGTGGYLVPMKDPAAMAARLAELMDDQELRARMGQNARRRAEAFSIAQMTKAYEDYMLEALR